MDKSFLLNNFQMIPEKMKLFGFSKSGGKFVFSAKLKCAGFVAKFSFAENYYHVNVFDGEEEYVLFNVENSTGKFLGDIRQEVEKIEKDIFTNCFENINMRHFAEQYIKDTYNAKTEFPWKEYPSFETFKETKNNKWFALIMTIPAEKIKAGGNELVDVINVKCDPNNVQTLVDGKHIFPAYHMNKKMWITVLLNKNTDKEKLQKLIDNSYWLVSSK